MDALAADTAERLRSKHVRTLEVMQQLVNENAALKQQLERCTGGHKHDATIAGNAEELVRQLAAQREEFEKQVRVVVK